MSERSEAQKAADKKYAEKVKGKYQNFAIPLKKEEKERYEQILKEHGLGKVEFLRWAIAELEKKEK